jgi:plastocyanin
MKPRRIAPAAIAITALLAFPGTSSGDTFRVKATGDSPTTFEWMPDFRHITKGNRIRWTNPTGATHRVVAYSNNWSKNTAIAPGERTSKVFRQTGEYLYRCTRPGHSTLTNGDCGGMCGEIHVTRN